RADVPEPGALRHRLGRHRRRHGVLRHRPAVLAISQAVSRSAYRVAPARAGKAGVDDQRDQQSATAGAPGGPPEGPGQSRPPAHLHGQAEQRVDGAGVRAHGARHSGRQWHRRRVPCFPPHGEPGVGEDVRGHARRAHADHRAKRDGAGCVLGPTASMPSRIGASEFIHIQCRLQEAVMATQTRTQAKATPYGLNIETDLAPEFLRVVENAAIACARTMGQGDRKLSDHVATEAMRKTMDTVPMHGTIVIGEGERDEAPMLYIGEKVGAEFPDGMQVPDIDIAVDPLEGTNLCATGAPGAITVLAASERGGLLHAPDCYMEKIVVGPSCKGAVEMDAPVADNLRNVAKRL